jgi:hypothetical protein
MCENQQQRTDQPLGECGRDVKQRRRPGEGQHRVHDVPRGRPGELGPARVALADDVRPRVLRRGDDARRGVAVRHGPVRDGLPGESAAERRHDRGGDAHQQDGTGPPEGVRSDARAAVGRVHGLLRERRGVLPLQLRR